MWEVVRVDIWDRGTEEFLCVDERLPVVERFEEGDLYKNVKRDIGGGRGVWALFM